MSSSNLEGKKHYAEWFIGRGYAVFPTHPQTKKPVIKEWQRYSHESLTETEKAEFLKVIEQGHNYAVPGGQKNLVILDLEDLQSLKQWIGEEALNDICKRTLCVNTPHGGVHIFLTGHEIPEHKINPVFIKGGKGIADLQSYNSYVVGVGSCINHKYCDSEKCPWRGQDYITCYTLYNELKEIGKVDLKGFIKFLTDKGEKLGIELSPSAKEWTNGKGTKEQKELGEKDLEKLKKEMLVYYRYKGKTVEAVKGEVCGEMKKANEVLKDRTDPKSQRWKAIYRIAIPVVCEGKTYADIGIDRSRADWNVFRALFTHGVTDLDVVEQLLPPDAKVFAPKWGYYVVHTISKAWRFSKPALRYQRETTGKSEKEKKEIARRVIADVIMERYKIRTFYRITGHNQAVIGAFIWDKKKGIYVPFDKELRKLIRKTAERMNIGSLDDKTLSKLSKRDVDDISDEIKDLTLTVVPQEPLRVAFKNGTLYWDNGKVRFYTERTPKEYSFYYLPWDLKYDELMKMGNIADASIQDIEGLARRLCPKSLETFKAWVGQKWILLFEIIGYTFYPAYKFRKAFMLVGEGKNGKSSFINLLKVILGDYAISISPRELFDPTQRFVVGNLYHKLANAVAESKDYSIDDMDRVKRLTGDDWITADVKFKDPITFKNVAKLVIASNNMPHVRDTDDKAFWHRWVILGFPNQFKDDNLWFEKTFTEEEINGIVTTSVVAISRAFRQGHFDFEQTEEEIMDIWLSHIDSVYSFVKEYTERGILRLEPKNGDLFIPKWKLHKLYYEYCGDNGYRGVDERRIPKLLGQYFNITVSKKTLKVKDKITGGYKDERVRCYVGIGISESVKKNTVINPINMIDNISEYVEYVKKNKNAVKEFGELVQDFGDRKKANGFVYWCELNNFCTPRGVDRFEIHV